MAASAGDKSDEIKRNVRAVLLSKIGGVPVDNFSRDYRDLLGQPFPYRKFGYQTMRQCLQAMPDVVRFEIKDGKDHLFGIADDSSFMSSFAVKAQFPEYEEKKDKRKRNRGNKGGKKDNAVNRNAMGGKSHQRQPNSMGGAIYQQDLGNPPASMKYPELVGNMQGLFCVVVLGATAEESKGIETLFQTIGPVEGRSQCGNLLFYRFGNVHHAEAVIDKFHGFKLGRFTLKVEPAKEKIPRRKQDSQASFNNPSQKVNKTKDESLTKKLSPTEQQIQDLNASLLSRMNQFDDADEGHHGNVQNANRTVNADSAKLKQTDRRQNYRHDEHQERPNRTSPDSHMLGNSQQRHGDGRHFDTNHRGGDGQKTQNPRQNKTTSEEVDVYVGNIANNLLEKDVKSFMAPYNPKRSKFNYPPGRHTYFNAIFRLNTTDAERAIQALNGKLMSGMPLSVRPYTKKPPARVRNPSEGSSISESLTGADSNVADLKAANREPPRAREPNASGDWTEKPMPSLADFIDRFKDVNI